MSIDSVVLYLCLFFAIILFYIARKQWKRLINIWYSPTSLYALLWGVVWFIHAINILDYKHVNSLTVLLSLLPLIFMFLGETTALLKFNSRLVPKLNYVNIIDQRRLKKAALIISLVGLYSGFFSFISSYLLFGSSVFTSIQYLRNIRSEEGIQLFSGFLPSIFYKYNLILQGASFAGVIVGYAYSFIYDNKYYLGIVISILGSLLFDFAAGSRTFTFTTVSLYLFLLFITRFKSVLLYLKSLKRNIFSWKFYIFSILIAIAFISINYIGTNTRDAKVRKIGKTNIPFSVVQFLDYNVGGLISFDETFDKNDILWGRMSFSGIEQWFRITKILPEEINPPKEISEWGATYVPLQPDNWYKRTLNTFTWLRYLYVDFGVFGLIIIPFILGLIITKNGIRWLKTGHIYHLFVYIYLCMVILRSLTEMIYCNDNYIFSIILLIGTSFYVNKKYILK
jgi:oligosaccharide repeat unit polymerase